MMTTMAAMLGALPLAIGCGEGAELRQPLGISIVGGLILSQVLTLYTTPVVYLYLDRFRLWSQRMRRGNMAAAGNGSALQPGNRYALGTGVSSRGRWVSGAWATRTVDVKRLSRCMSCGSVSCVAWLGMFWGSDA